ncbi:Beta-defensin 104A, partial [Heterocephalus glaber]
PVRSDLEVDRICGYGTARCHRKCKSQEHKIARCPNTYACCLKTWAHSSLNIKRP